ncbi:unnamed protein product [Danaus chrysippus]|uniref:(African queen) hypothetical protein n=1 Tax=Danaus chrysippus TaxID=151541 RepID=A0A8J2QPV4_9NEOP|nr:unnamed protein product [Danaus chrysippus]
MSKVAVVTGSNKGLGLGIVKGLCKRFEGVVYLTSRDEKRGRDAVAELNKQGLQPKYYQLDVSDKNSVLKFKNYIEANYGGIDILINNAAVTDSNPHGRSSYEDSKKLIDINFGGILTMRELIYPLVRRNGRILNISSNCGHLSNLRNQQWREKLSKKDLKLEEIQEFIEWYLESLKNGSFNPEDWVDNGTITGYRVSKIALNAVTRIHQKEFEAKDISINSVHPGYIRTDMTTGLGFFNIDEAAETPLYIVLDAPQSLKGEYIWYDRKVIDWANYEEEYYFRLMSLVEQHVA